jgi:hypothetical protein
LPAKNVRPPRFVWCPRVIVEDHRRQAGSYRTAFDFAFALHHSSRLSGRCALAFDFDLRRPVKHAGRNSTGIWGVNRQGCRFSRPAPWMARGGGPPNTWRITGTPSLGEVPSVGARALCLLWGFSKVSRRKGGTISSRYLNNGYVPSLIQHSGRLSGRLRGQASSHSFESRGNSQSVVGC